MHGQKKITEYCQTKGMLRTDKYLGMELVQAEIPINLILAMKNDFETMKGLLSQIVNEMTSFNTVIRNQIYQAIYPHLKPNPKQHLNLHKIFRI
jgi:hypothetical protein